MSAILNWARDVISPPGDWFFTRSGRRQWVRRPVVEDIVLDDVAEALAKTCRYGGHAEGFYSVAQHAVIVSYLVPPEDAFEGLNHDDPEAYLGDVIRPIKRAVREYRKLERIWEPVIAEALGFRHPMPASVKPADLYALAWERRDLAPWSDPTQNPDAWQWREDERKAAMSMMVDAARPRIVPLEWREAKQLFLNRFHELAFERLCLSSRPIPPRIVARLWCDRSPDGWWCTREPGHDGPCAAWPKLEHFNCRCRLVPA